MQLTDEQQAIIHHPLGRHARVLAVAGSGKTTTMVHRIKYLVEEQNQNPKRIRVVMFNRLARQQFEEKLAADIFSQGKRPKVLTFHALALSMYKEAEKQRLLPVSYTLWTGDRAELAHITVMRAIDSLLSEKILMDDVDPGEALDAIGLWKASLIPPEHAGHHLNPDLELVYGRFEEMREEARALTFDDFVPMALKLMDLHPEYRRRFTNQLDHLIVDEYQDINYGQQQLIRLLAGSRADVMVVGDDDQTIYEWRGARPYYILEGFKVDFSNKPVSDYTLSHSFRFGPEIAQLAYNVITFNTKRADKPLIAHRFSKLASVMIEENESEQPTEIEKEMADEIVTLIKTKKAKPTDVIVLGRTFTQMDGLQAAFLEKKIPFHIIGKPPFFERDENRTLVDYMRLALKLDLPPSSLKPWRTFRNLRENESPVQKRDASYYRKSPKGSYAEAIRTVLAVANTPSRKLARNTLRKAIENGGKKGYTIRESLTVLLDEKKSPFSEQRRESLQELLDILQRIAELSSQNPSWRAGDALEWLVDTLDYQQHFENYYGAGTASHLRIASINIFIRFAKRIDSPLENFIEFLSKLDTTRGQPLEKTIAFTTVHRTKGLEYDYVFLPNTTEGNMPVHIADEVGIYDKSGKVPEHPLSLPIESERRLFYVAITRAKRQLSIGTNRPPERGLQSQSTVSLPSRFLEEMQIGETQMVIDALQKGLEEGNHNAFLNLINKKTVPKTILYDVAKHYLKSVVANQGKRESILAQIAALSDTNFQYHYEYPPLETVSQRKEKGTPAPPLWAEDEDPWAWIS